jgi:hypothetical protein
MGKTKNVEFLEVPFTHFFIVIVQTGRGEVAGMSRFCLVVEGEWTFLGMTG